MASSWGRSLESPQVAGFLSTVARFDGPTEASRWIPLVLGEGSSELYNQIPIYGFPESGFQDREAYLLWKEEWYPGLLKILPAPLSP